MQARIAIVGGGVMGTAIALAAARRSDPIEAPVALFERAELAAGSSGRSGAILRQHYASREVAAMARDSLRAYASFEARTGRSIGFRRCGVLTLAGPLQGGWLRALEENVAMMRSIGIDTRLVGAREIRELVPAIEVEEGTLGAYEPGGGFVEPRRTVEAFASLARFHGAITRLGTAVTGFRVEAGRVRGVETVAGPVEAEQVVVAAGPWTQRLLKEVGLDLPLRAVRPEQHFVRTPSLPGADGGPEAQGSGEELTHEGLDARFAPRTGPPPVAHPVLLDLQHGFYTRCEPESARTRVGGMDYEHCQVLDDPDQLDERVDPAFSRWARGALVRRLPPYEREPDAGTLAAWYTITPDAQALIGPLPEIEGLFVVSGFSGHGFKLAPSIGEGVAQMLFGEPVSAFDPAFFSPLRFRAGVERWGGKFGL